MMITNVWICLMLVLQCNYAMRCRSGNSEVVNDIEKVILQCRRSDSQSGRNDSDSSRLNDSTEDDFASSDSSGLFNQDFFSNAKKDIQNITNNYGNGSSFKGNNPDSYGQQSSIQSSYMNPSNYTNMREYQNQKTNHNDNGFMIDGMQQENQGTDGDPRQSCIVQCIFEELNSVDQRGFPERASVTRMLLRGIQDPMVHDFIGESILQCFQFLSSEMNYDKCTFSQNLLNCLADKGKEQCEDWND
uniref:Odorant-binding protein 8 n=1 Tax=Meteorus pulchricornis TaxID=51522 RepID=A0A1S5VFH5_9HYME|nr:odorant-binding protein 8 [Meteorus pulchricornis]